MVRQRKYLVLPLCAIALVLTGCGRSPAAKPMPALTLQSLGDPVGTKIDDSDRPDPPPGFTDKDMDALAALLIAISKKSFSREVLDVKDVEDKLDRSLRPLATSYPETGTELLKLATSTFGRLPWQQIFIDPFGPGSKPLRPAKILKVDWHTEGGKDYGKRHVQLQLEVHAAYDVGTKAAPRIIVVQRMIELFTYGLDYLPSLGGEATAYGVDRCVAAIDGEYDPTRNKKIIDEDRRLLKKSLASRKINQDDRSDSVAQMKRNIKTCRTTG